jgi:hypothetical protein
MRFEYIHLIVSSNSERNVEFRLTSCICGGRPVKQRSIPFVCVYWTFLVKMFCISDLVVVVLLVFRLSRLCGVDFVKRKSETVYSSGVHIFSKCILSRFMYLIDLDVHLLQIQHYYCR